MNRIVIIVCPKTGDWLTKNDFTSLSQANQFILDHEAFNGYVSHSIPTQGDHWQRQRNAIQIFTNRIVQTTTAEAKEAEEKVPAIEETVVSQEAKAELHKASSPNANPGTVIPDADDVDDGTAPEAPLTPAEKLAALTKKG